MDVLVATQGGVDGAGQRWRGARAVAPAAGGQLGAGVTLPGAARAVRMDPLGRYLLVRAAEGDSAWVVAVGTRRLVGAVRTAWRADLPFQLRKTINVADASILAGRTAAES